jgi:hypothetical protein
MPTRDRRRVNVVLGLVGLCVLLAAGLVLVDLFVDPSWRAVAVQMLAAALLALAVLRVRTVLRLRLEAQPSSTFDVARADGERSASEASRVAQLESEIGAGLRYRRFFEAVLWPQLVALAEARAGAPPTWLTRPPDRSFGRGPSRAALEAVVAEIEARR